MFKLSRLRPRSSQNICYEDSDVSEGDEEACCRRKKTKNLGCKRKTKVTIESLYRQENMKEFSSTPLETIYESPRRGQGRGVKGKRREEKTREGDHDGMTSLNDICDLNLSMMTKRKFKRLCLFTSHYYPSKNKTRVRKERARLMKQRRGVIVPDGGAISIKDVEMVLSCLSDNEDKNENDKNVMNSSCLNVNRSGFYVGNVIRPDIHDVAVDDIIQNIGTLRMNISEVNIGIQSAVDETIIAPMLFDGLVPSLPLTDEPSQSCSLNSREKKLRRRSGRLSGCLLPPVAKTSENTLSGEHQINEQLCTTMQRSVLSDSSVRPKVSEEEELQNTLRPEELCESSTSLEELSGISHPEQVKPPVNKTLKFNQRRKSIKERKKKDKNIGNQSDKPKTIAEKRARQIEPSEQENGLRKVSKMKMGTKRTNKSGAESDMKKRRDSKSDDSKELRAEELSESEVDIKPRRRCERQWRSNQQQKRRVSGIRRPLYSTMLELANPDTSGNWDSNKSFDELKDVAESPISTVEQDALSRSYTVVTQEGASTDPSGMAMSDSAVCHHCPTSPSTQMAALSLSTDNSPVSVINSCPSPPTHLKKNKENNGLRRSARLSTGSAVIDGLVEKPLLGLGTYWSASLQSCNSTKDVNTADSTHAPGGSRTSIPSSHLIEHESLLIERSNTESAIGGRMKQMVSSSKGRRSSGFARKQDLIVVANGNSKATDGINIDNARDYHTAGTYGNSMLYIESDDDIPQDIQGSQALTKNNSVCAGTEYGNHPSHELTHNARIISLPLRGTCGVKTQERSVTSIPRQNLFGLGNEKQDANITFTMKNLYNVDEETQNSVTVDCARPDVKMSQDFKKTVMECNISSYSSLVSSNPPQDTKTPGTSDHILQVTHDVKHNGLPVIHPEGSSLMPAAHSDSPATSAISSYVS